MEICVGPLQKNTSYFPTLSSESEPEEFEVDRPVLANLQAEPGFGMSPGCINKAKEICNYESGLEIHGCPRHLHPLSPALTSSVALSDVSAYPHHRVRAEFHGGCAAGKVEGSTADEYANPGAVPVPASDETVHNPCVWLRISNFLNVRGGDSGDRWRLMFRKSTINIYLLPQFI